MKKFSLAIASAALVFGLAAAETYQQAFNEMNSLRNKGKRKEALVVAERARKLAKTPYQKGQSMFYTGVIECEMRQYDKGIATLKKAVTLYKVPAHKISCQFHLGYYLGQSRKYAEAITAMKQTIAFGKGVKHTYVENARIHIGRFLYNLKKYKEALASAQKAAPLLKDPNQQIFNYSVIFDAASALNDKKTAEDAVKKMTAVKTASPYYSFTVWRHAANYYRSAKQYAKSLEYAKRICNDKKQSRHYRIHGHYYAALALDGMGKKSEAVSQWKILEKSGVTFFVNAAKKRLASGKK